MNRFGANIGVDAVAAAIEEDGYAIIEDLDPALVSRAMLDLDHHIVATSSGAGNFSGEHAKNVEGLIGKSDAAHQLIVHDTALALCDRLLLSNCVRYQVNYTGCLHLGPGTPAQDLHRDGDMYPFQYPHPTTILASMWAGTDFTADNGATRLVPGSHRWSDDRTPNASEVMAAEMPAGSLLLYTGGVIHGGGANTSKYQRTGISVQYSLGWLRQEENLHLAVPPELARTLPDRLARLIGYGFGGPYTGFVHGDDPHRLLEDRALSPRCHSYPDLDAAAMRLKRWRWGEVEALPSPAPDLEPAPLTVSNVAEFGN